MASVSLYQMHSSNLTDCYCIFALANCMVLCFEKKHVAFGFSDPLYFLEVLLKTIFKW